MSEGAPFGVWCAGEWWLPAGHAAPSSGDPSSIEGAFELEEGVWVVPLEPPPPALTPRQQEVARLVLRGLTDAQIADALGVSPYTVRTHLERIFERTGSATRVELVHALRNG